MNEPHPVRWKSMIGLGILSALLGLFMLFFSEFSSQIIVALAGFAIILLSAIFVVEGLCIDAEGWTRWGILTMGALGLILGVISIVVPSLILISTGVLLGIFFMIYGIGELVIGIGIVFVETMVRMIFIMLGIISIVVGLFLVIHPDVALEIFIWLIGLYLMVLGLMRIAQGWNERDTEQKMPVKHL
jgi:uncharacterized membrane protein HdeD (DUF308 family)